MFGKKKPEVLVAGAGPVGLYAALALAERGVRVHIVDRDWGPAAHSYALALHPASLRLLEDVGLLGDVLAHAYRVRTIGLYDGARRRAEVHLSELGEDFSFLSVLRQDDLESQLEQALRQHGVKVRWNHDVSRLIPEQDHVTATIDRIEKESMGYGVAHMEWIVAKSQELDVPFVIGADGHRSRVRRALHIDFEEIGPPQHFAVFEFKTNVDLQHEMRVVLDEHTTDVLWPLPDGYCRWSFQLQDDEATAASREKDRYAVQIGRAHYTVLSEAHLHELIEQRAPWFEGSVEEVDWKLVVRFERRLATRFGAQRLWLAGDAAHMTGPVGVQSMNVGLREAENLAARLAGILHQGASPDQLQAYERERQHEWRFLLGLEGELQASDRTDPWVRQHRERLLSCLPASGADLAHLAQQLNLTVFHPVLQDQVL